MRCGTMGAMKLRGLKPPRLLAALRAASPPFDAETERELIALAYGHDDREVSTAALKLVTKHVRDAAAVKAALGQRLASKHGGFVDKAVRRLKRPDRGQIASALVRHGVNATALAFEEDPAFMRALLPKLVDRKRELFLTNWKRSATSHYAIALHALPDAWFDELPALHRSTKFDTLVIWGTRLADLPPRFAELAPYLRRLRLAFNRLTELPDIVLACKNLEHLEVCEQNLQRLNPRLSELTRLRSLQLGHAKAMRTVPPEIAACGSLEELYLGAARFTQLPPELARLPRLHKLGFQGTPIGKPPRELAALPIRHANVRWSKVSREAAKALWPRARIES